jgi:Holliday junction resolvase RusA-like endonuclease
MEAVAIVGELKRLRSITFTVHGTPVPKARARKGKGGHWHTPQKTIDYEQLVGIKAMAARIERDRLSHVANQPPWPLDAHYRVECAMYFPNERRVDGDNVFKAVADAMNGSIYLDDSRVIETATLKRIDRDNPRIDVRVYELESP